MKVWRVEVACLLLDMAGEGMVSCALDMCVTP